jgi:natural product precursor
MKKLEKIKLQNAVVLENSEMKAIYGGSGTF